MQTIKIDKEEIVRDEIINAAQSLFQKYGLNKTTMEDIAKASGKGKSTIYYYYTSKDDIFEVVVYKELDALMFDVNNVVNKYDTAEGKITAYIRANFRLLEEKTLLYQIVCGEMKPRLNQMLLKIREKFDSIEIKLIKGILLLGMKNGEFKGITEKNVEVLASVFISAIRGIEIDAFIEHKLPECEEDSTELFCAILLNGIKK